MKLENRDISTTWVWHGNQVVGDFDPMVAFANALVNNEDFGNLDREQLTAYVIEGVVDELIDAIQKEM